MHSIHTMNTSTTYHKFFSGLFTAQLTVGARAFACLSTIIVTGVEVGGEIALDVSVHELEPDDACVVWYDCATIVSYCES